MKPNHIRNGELLASGLVEVVKKQFQANPYIPKKYHILMADYIDSLKQAEHQLHIDPNITLQRLSSAVANIHETNLNGIHGRTDDNRIIMDSSLNEYDTKLYFFHELTHTLQGGFGDDAMFLTEGATQYLAEKLTSISNRIEKRSTTNNSIRKLPNHYIDSSMSEYQFNGNVLEMIALATNLSIDQIMELSFKENGRKKLREIYDAKFETGSFEILNNNLEMMYNIDKLIIFGNYNALNTPQKIEIISSDGLRTYNANMITYNETVSSVQRELMGNFILENSEEYILQNYQKFERLLTTRELKWLFNEAIKEIVMEYKKRNEKKHLSLEKQKELMGEFISKGSHEELLSNYEQFAEQNLDEAMKEEFYGYIREIQSLMPAENEKGIQRVKSNGFVSVKVIIIVISILAIGIEIATYMVG